MSATNVGTSFAGGIGSALTMSGTGGINVEYISAPVYTYTGGLFSLTTTLASDTSSGGLARGTFTGGTFSYKDGPGSTATTLLSGSITSLSLTETYNGSGRLFGDGQFTVTGGSLQPNFGLLGSYGDMVDISFTVIPKTISNFASSFTASSDVTVLPSVPEPTTIGLLGMGGLMLFRKKIKPSK
jgi:hypothetical protein